MSLSPTRLCAPPEQRRMVTTLTGSQKQHCFLEMTGLSWWKHKWQQEMMTILQQSVCCRKYDLWSSRAGLPHPGQGSVWRTVCDVTSETTCASLCFHLLLSYVTRNQSQVLVHAHKVLTVFAAHTLHSWRLTQQFSSFIV